MTFTLTVSLVRALTRKCVWSPEKKMRSCLLLKSWRKSTLLRRGRRTISWLKSKSSPISPIHSSWSYKLVSTTKRNFTFCLSTVRGASFSACWPRRTNWASNSKTFLMQCQILCFSDRLGPGGAPQTQGGLPGVLSD